MTFINMGVVMAFVSITRLRLRSLRYLPAFMRDALITAQQAKKAPGNLRVRLRKTQGLTFWTLTVWQNESAMAAYRVSGPHKKAMPKLQQWCDEASVANWSQDTDVLPGWKEIKARMLSGGHLSRLTYPSRMHERGEINVS